MSINESELQKMLDEAVTCSCNMGHMMKHVWNDCTRERIAIACLRRYPERTWRLANDFAAGMQLLILNMTPESDHVCAQLSRADHKICEFGGSWANGGTPTIVDFEFMLGLNLDSDLEHRIDRDVNYWMGHGGDLVTREARFLLSRLVERGDLQLIAEMYAHFDKIDAKARAEWEANEPKRLAIAEREAGRERRAKKKDCPICGSSPGDDCVIQPGYANSGKRRTHVHADRLRDADHLLRAGDES